MKQRTIVAFVGKQGSGKTTLGKQLAKYAKIPRLETSEVIKRFVGDLPREDLPATGKLTKEDPDWLGKALKKEVEHHLKIKEKKAIVICGIREIEAQRYLQKFFNFYSFEVVADPEIRMQRLIDLEKILDAKEFLIHEAKEAELGVAEVEEAAPYTVPTSFETDPRAITKAVVRQLINNKVKLV